MKLQLSKLLTFRGTEDFQGRDNFRNCTNSANLSPDVLTAKVCPKKNIALFCSLHLLVKETQENIIEYPRPPVGASQ